MDSRPRSPTIGTDAPAVYGGAAAWRGEPRRGQRREGGDRATRHGPAGARQSPAARVKDEPDVKDIGLGARPARVGEVGVQTPGPIEYARATSVDNAIALLAERGPDARVIAGGHSLLPMMKLRLANPELLVDINDLTDLAYIREQDGQVRIGAMTRHYQLLESELLARHFPLFADAEHVIADPVVRNRGTIGGSLAQADAAEDLSAVCSALKAETVIRGADGERVVAMEDFHVGPYMTAIGDAEILTEIRIPLQARRRQRAREGRAAGRRLGDRRGRRGGVDGRRPRSPTPAWR